MKKRVIALLLITICVVTLEVTLRNLFGFCDSVLIREDPHYEYIAQPSQSRYRFGNRVFYNSLSMRSEEVDTAATIILGFGDSIINGGVHVAQDSLATNILSDTLTSSSGRKIQFLNISAASWGPDNCFAYLQKHGDFNAKGIYLFVNSEDARDNMSFKKVVDIDENYPSEQYTSAIVELSHRYLLPATGLFGVSAEQFAKDQKKRNSSKFNPGFSSFLNYARKKNIPLTIYLHPMKSEIENNSYSEEGQEIIRFAERHNIKIIKALEKGMDHSEFRDYIHLNADGHRKLALRVLEEFEL
jgi:hypothetical protein